MEDTRMEVLVKQEPLDEDVYDAVKYPVCENQMVHVPSLPVETSNTKQKLLSTCNGEAFVVCTTVMGDDAMDSTHLNVVKQRGNGSAGCKVKREPVAQHTCCTNVPLKWGEADKADTDVPGPDFHRNLPISMALAVDETPFPVALYQHEPRHFIGEKTSRTSKIALECESTMSTSFREITSDNVTSEHGLESQEMHRCSVCNYKTARKRNLSRHVRTHAEEKPYRCSVCSYSSTIKCSLVLHTRTHTGEKPFKCSICDYSAAQNNSLVIHMRTHTGEKPYKCPVCFLAFSCNSHVRIHMRLHTGEKPYKCSICDYSSAYKHDLASHTKRHTGEKPHKCSLCDYCSVSRSQLVEHMRTHTGEKPYKCSICDYSAAKKGTLVNHINRHIRHNKPHRPKSMI